MNCIFLFWIIAGLMVLYRLGVDEIIESLKMEAKLSLVRKDHEEEINSLIFMAVMFLTVLMWPLVLLEYQKSI